ncbi:DUF6093 family protein [Nonomuraea sp. bgisy101]|uniref:DUF6093 family protein n=1 Tax=Nonomuraea sp. bgisy101 TaxID=3413784 RepID=UPI003D73B05E
MSLQDALAAARALLPRFMEEQCVVERYGGRVFNATTGKYDEVWTPIYTGACAVKPVAAGRDTELGEIEVVLRRYRVSIPFGAAVPIKPDDRTTVTSSADPWLVDRPLRVVDVSYSATSASRKFFVEDQS